MYLLLHFQVHGPCHDVRHLHPLQPHHILLASLSKQTDSFICMYCHVYHWLLEKALLQLLWLGLSHAATHALSLST